MSGWYDAKTPYRSILAHLKSKGIRVYHRKMKNGAGAMFDCRQTIITVDKECRDTWEGCALLCHELAHSYDYREGKFLKFFEEKLEFSEENLQLVIDAEMSAVRGGAKLLKMWGIKTQPKELTEEGFQESLKFWQKYYFSKN